MEWSKFIEYVANNPVFNTGFLSAVEDSKYLRVQISRWVRQKRLIKLKKGYYMLNKPYIKDFPNKMFIANLLKQPSYISFESALSYYSLIPEYVPSIKSITTARPQTIYNELGIFIYKHLKRDLFWGYKKIRLGQDIFIAEKEKALIDMFYFNSKEAGYVKELRLQNLETLDLEKLNEYAERTGKKKIISAVKLLIKEIV